MTILIRAGLALLDADTPPLRDSAVIVEGETIVAVGVVTELRARYPVAQEVGGATLLLIPALCDARSDTTHLSGGDQMRESHHLIARPHFDPYTLAACHALRLLHAGVSTAAVCFRPGAVASVEEASAAVRAYRDVGLRVALHIPHGPGVR
jgi:cytosine/adenosine deaminase-related metal-dependent hydrolase